MADDDGRFVVLNDAPAGEGGNEDLMETGQVARGLADLIIASRAAAPFTLAIDAAWGMGKSSLMLRLTEVLKAEPDVSVVWFNAWTSGKASAVEGLIKTVLLRFDRNVIRRAVRAMSGRGNLIGVLRAAAMLTATFFGIRGTVDEIWRMLALDAKSRNEIKGVLRDALKAWTDKGSGSGHGRLLVVFVDDLDRCADERIVEVCEAVKLYLDVPGIVFVFACDQALLLRAVRGSAGVGNAVAAAEYLEKIVQFSYRIPPASTSAALRLVDGYLAKSGTAQLFDESMKNVVIERSGRNPRRIKRLINGFILEYHLNPEWREVGFENLVRIILLQNFYLGFYRILTDPRGDDPVHDFLAYHDFRAGIRLRRVEESQKWRDLFAAKGIEPPDGTASHDELVRRLASLEEELPMEFPALAADRDFVALVRSFDRSIDSEQFRLMLRRPLRATPVTAYDPTPVAGVDPVDGMRILWIDDNQHSHRTTKDHLRRRGAIVVLATTRASALAAFDEGEPDVLLSDFTREGNINAGIEDLVHFRNRRQYHGPVIFVSSNNTPARQEHATALGAIGVTNDRAEILNLIDSIAER